MRNYILWGLTALFVVLVFACSKESIESSEKELLNFSIGDFMQNAEGTVDPQTKTVTLQAIEGVDITKLVPIIKVSDKASVSPASGVAQDFTKPVTYTITAEDGSKQAFIVTVLPAKSSLKQITCFKFLKINPEVIATIDQEKKKINLKVPYGTNIIELVPTISLSDKSAVLPASEEMQDFTKPVVYTVTAEDGSKQEYTVTVEVGKRSEKMITEFKFAKLNPAVSGAINEEAKTISLITPAGTDVTSLMPTLTLSEGAEVSPASDVKQDFTKPVVYTVTAEDGSKQEYTVTVEVAKRIDKKITEFKLAGLNPAVTAKVDEDAKAISLVVTAGTDVTSLMPTLTLSEGAEVSPASDVKQDFTKPVVYTVTAEDGSKQEYTVTVEVAKRTDKKITEFKFAGLNPAVTAKVDEEVKAISLVVPVGTDVTTLIPTLTLSEGAQVSPASDVKQDFTKPVVYTVTAEDGSTQEYTVTVEVVKRTDKKIAEFKLAGLNPAVTAKVDEEVKAISLVVPVGTDVTTLIPTLTLSEGAQVSPASDVKQDFTKPVVYTVTAEDGTTQEYTVTVEIGKRTDKKIAEFRFGSLNANGTINEAQKTIDFLFPAGTNVTALAPTIALSDGATVSPASDVKQDFTNPVTYTVTAEDGSIQKYVVTAKVEIRKSSENRITEFKFASLTPIVIGNINDGSGTISMTVPTGTDVTSLVPSITLSEGAQISPSLNETQDFSRPVVYTVTAEDGSTRAYTVIVKAPSGKEKDILSFQFSELSARVDIEQSTRRIKVILPPATNLSALTPTLSISEGARVSPASGEIQNFTKPLVYTVTAADGSTARYTVNAEVEVGTKNEITSFIFDSFTPASEGIIDLEKHIVTVIVPKGTDLKELKPIIAISPAADISPASGVVQDFTKPVSYSVMSENGLLQTYTVTVTIDDKKSSAKEISEFSFFDKFPYPKVSINQEEHLIKIIATPRAGIEKISPRIKVSEGATVSPAPYESQNFTKPVIYTVTAEDGTTQKYTVTVEVIKSSAKKMHDFYITSCDPWAIGEIDDESHSVTIDIPTNVDLSHLAPKIEISDYAKIVPDSRVVQDFTKPVVYTITAEDGSTQEYTVYASREKNTEKDIKEFRFASLNPEAVGRISSDNRINIVVKPGTDVTALAPTITLSKWAKVRPMSGLPQDFSKPIIYTVTAEDGTTKEYTVSIISDEKKILSYKFTSFTPEVVGVIDEQSATIRTVVPWNTDPETLKPVITVSPKATIKPNGSESIDFGFPVEYVVTAEDGSTATYKAYVSRAYNEEAKIYDFKFKNLNAAGVIDQDNKRITVRVPYGTRLEDLSEEIKISEKASITPKWPEKIDYSSPVTFTVKAENGATASYIVEVIVDKFTTAITYVDKEKVEREEILTIKGNFYPDRTKVLLEGEKTIEAFVKEESSSVIKVSIPEFTPFGEYKLSVISGESKATYHIAIRVNKFAKNPTIKGFASDKVNPGGYLQIYGNNFKQDGFNTEVRIGDYTPIKDLTVNSDGTDLKVPIPSNMPLGRVYLNIVCGESFSGSYQIEIVSTAPSPSISKVSATDIKAGDDITISGAYFASKNNRVWFENENGVTYSSEIFSENTDEIKIKTHNLPEGSRYTLYVDNGNSKSSHSQRLSVKLGTTKITSVSPGVLGKDEIITVEGEYIYQRSYEVEIGGKMCPTSYKDSKSFYVYLPYNISSGTYDLKIAAIGVNGKYMGSLYSGRVTIR